MVTTFVLMQQLFFLFICRPSKTFTFKLFKSNQINWTWLIVTAILQSLILVNNIRNLIWIALHSRFLFNTNVYLQRIECFWPRWWLLQVWIWRRNQWKAASLDWCGLLSPVTQLTRYEMIYTVEAAKCDHFGPDRKW